jgi:hypothetical protein
LRDPNDLGNLRLLGQHENAAREPIRPSIRDVDWHEAVGASDQRRRLRVDFGPRPVLSQIPNPCTQMKSPVAVSIGALLLATTTSLLAWTPIPVKSDQLVFMPGTQPGGASLESSNRCDNCHGGYNTAVEPAHNWRGSMMAQAARDPLWQACRTVALQDSIWALGNPNAGDLCIRCHTPAGWLGGRSDPTNGILLTSTDLNEGVSCDACHRIVDPMHGLRQLPLAPESTSLAITEANKTYTQDGSVLAAIKLFAGDAFYDPATSLPKYYSNGYVEGTSGQYFVDPGNAKRGPRADAAPKHQFLYSRFHKTAEACGTCHDVSNPVLAQVLDELGLPEKKAAGLYMHVERTFSEFKLSAYGRGTGAMADPKIGVGNVNKCQDCHMRDVTGYAANKSGIPHRTDLALHDLTGGNVWMSNILASADVTGPNYDAYNHALLSGSRFAGASVEVTGLQGQGAALTAGAGRAKQQLEMAATIDPVEDASTHLVLRVRNNSGHKLISGFPEGRRMWLNVQFRNSDGEPMPADEVNPYTALVITRNAQNDPVYVSGGTLVKTDDDLVYEAETTSELTGETKTFHFVLATGRHKDNRIPPKGFDIADAAARIATPVWAGVNAPDYFTVAEYAGGYDEVVISKPEGAASWVATLYYQSTSKEYIEFLRDEIRGTAGKRTLSEPTLHGGDPTAYLAQTDPFFSSLKGWGDAIWALWLHNGGCAPIAMTSATGGEVYEPPCAAPATPTGVKATAAKRSIKVDWTAVSGADGYRVYYYAGGKYSLKATVAGGTTTTYTDKPLTAGTTLTYAVTAYRNCSDGTMKESAFSTTATATAAK